MHQHRVKLHHRRRRRSDGSADDAAARSSSIRSPFAGARALARRPSVLLACLASLLGLVLIVSRDAPPPIVARRQRVPAPGEGAEYATYWIGRLRATAQDYGIGCSDDPEEEMTTIEMIRNSGYPAEEHFVTTEDGYILALHRIPGAKGSPVALLHHALLESSFCWIVNGKEKGLAYILANNGYDVWMGNARGNTYSRRHVNLSTSDPEFWNFSWHEMGVYDVPAEINYISKFTNKKLIYIGHSMGTTKFYVMASERPKVASKIKIMVGLAPVAFLDHIRGPFWLSGAGIQHLQKYFQLDGLNEFFAQNSHFKFIAKCICSKPILKDLCKSFIFSVVGFNWKNLNASMLPLILTHTPAGTSFKTLIHFAQTIGSRHFRNYNYGTEKNIRIYNNENSPSYDFSRIQVPVAFFWGQNDFLTQPKDVQNLFDQLPNTISSYKIEDPNFNHLDFIWGMDASKLVYSKLLLLLEKYRHTNEMAS